MREEAAEGDKDYGPLEQHALRPAEWREGAQAGAPPGSTFAQLDAKAATDAAAVAAQLRQLWRRRRRA